MKDTMLSLKGPRPAIDDVPVLGPSGVLINADLMSSRDKKLPEKVVLKPRELVRFTRLLVLMRGFAGSTVAPLATVFDGKSAHVVILKGFDRSKHCFLYSDPWVIDTFLVQRNNKADVNAVPHSGKQDDWQVKEDELERVLYKIVVRADVVRKLSEFLATMRGGTDQAVAAYLKIKADDPKNPGLDVVRLNRAGFHFLDAHEPETAVTVFTVNLKLNPSSAEAHAGLAEALSQRGQVGSAVEHEKQALEKVAGDSSLNEDEKASLSKRVAEQLRQWGRATAP